MTRLLIGSLFFSLLAVWVIEITIGVYFHVYKAWRLTNSTVPLPYQIKQEGGNDPINVLIIGDSIAAGVGASNVESTVHYQFLKKLKQYEIITVENFSVSGSLIHDLKGQLYKANGGHYDLVLISSMANDVVEDTSIKNLKKDIEIVINQAKTISNRVIWFTPASMKTSYAAPYLIRLFWANRQEKVATEIARLSEVGGVTFVDLIHSSLSANVAKNPKIYYASDYFHPNDKAYAEAAEIMFENTREILENLTTDD
jgi:lysophospholipase L1-like esterase